MLIKVSWLSAVEKYYFNIINLDSQIVYLILLNVLRPLFCALTLESWLNRVDEDDDEDEVGLKEKPEDTRYIKKITSK